jgi:hypothetical protein
MAWFNLFARVAAACAIIIQQESKQYLEVIWS